MTTQSSITAIRITTSCAEEETPLSTACEHAALVRTFWTHFDDGADAFGDALDMGDDPDHAE